MRCDYVDHLGSDLTVVNSARVSFDKESDWEWICEGCGINEGRPDKCIEGEPCEVFGTAPCCGMTQLSGKDRKLINYLAKHGHWSPFAHPQITLRYTVPIFIARQEFKHIVGFTRNEVSRRYVDDEPEVYNPDMWRARPEGSVKQGSGTAYVSAEELKGFDISCFANIMPEEIMQLCVSYYEHMLDKGVAPEQARMVLPQSMYTSYYVTGSLAAFARFYRQRSDTHAQFEIRELSEIVKSIVEPLYPVSWKALTE